MNNVAAMFLGQRTAEEARVANAPPQNNAVINNREAQIFNNFYDDHDANDFVNDVNVDGPVGAYGDILDQELRLYRNMPRVDLFYIEIGGGGVDEDGNPVDKLRYENPLTWWKAHEKQLPHLAVLSRKWLCIPATSAPSERVFSVAGLTISKKRAALTGDHAATLIFLRDSWSVVEEWERRQRARLA